MQIFEGVGIALSSIGANKGRASLTILGVAIGVAVVMVIASMITGFVCIPIFKFGFTRLPEVGILFEKMDVMLPSFILAILAGIIVSLLSKK